MILAGQALAADVYRGTAKFTNAKGERVSTPVTISLDGATPDAERHALVAKAKDGPEAAKSALAGQKAIGYIEAVDRRVPIRYAYVMPGGDGQLITVISDETLGYIGGDKKSAKPKEGFDLTYVQLQVDAIGEGARRDGAGVQGQMDAIRCSRGGRLRQAGRLGRRRYEDRPALDNDSGSTRCPGGEIGRRKGLKFEHPARKRPA